MEPMNNTGDVAAGAIVPIIVVAIVIIVVIALAIRSSQAESKEGRTIQSLPPSVQHAVAQMDATRQAAFFNEFTQKKKKTSVGYLAWLFFGWHYLYVGKVGLQFLYWLTAGGMGIWILVDLFRVPSITRAANEQAARQALQTLYLGTAYYAPPAPAGY